MQTSSTLLPLSGHAFYPGSPLMIKALASSIMPITSDSSTVTSVTASPLDTHDPTNPTIELKIPLPPSKSPSNHEESFQTEKEGEHGGWEKAIVNTEGENVGQISSAQAHDVSPDQPQAELVPEETSSIEPVPWELLTDLAKAERYDRWRLARLTRESRYLRLANGLNRRLKDTCSLAYGNLIDQFKGDDQAGFAGLYEASERLITQCNSLDSEGLADEPKPFHDQAQERDAQFEDSSPLVKLAQDDQDAVLNFLNRIRTDLDYLADLISELPPSELASLTSCYHPAGVDLSILPNHSHGRTQAYSRDSQMLKLSRRMDNIDLFHKRDPYFTLLYTIFDSSAESLSKEHLLKQNVWARTCARVMTEGKLGSEEFAIATIDSFVSTQNWDLKPELELYLLQVLAEGWFILDPPMEEPLEKAGSTMEPERASHAIAVEEFFDKHTRKLLDILTLDYPSAIPKDALNFIHATLSHIKDSQMKELAKKFVVSRWYFASFLSSLLVYPEVGFSVFIISNQANAIE